MDRLWRKLVPLFLPATFTGLDKRTSLLHLFSIHKNQPFILQAPGLMPLGSGCCLFQLDIAFLRKFVSEKSFFNPKNAKNWYFEKLDVFNLVKNRQEKVAV